MIQPGSVYQLETWVLGDSATAVTLSTSSSRQLDGTMPSQQGRAVTPYLLGTLSLLNWTRNGLTPMIGRHYAPLIFVGHNLHKLLHLVLPEQVTTHLTSMVSLLCKSKGTSWCCSWSQTLMWRSLVSRLLCALLIILIGIFWRRSSEGT